MIRDRPYMILYRWVHRWFTYIPSSSLILLYSSYFWLCNFFFTPILSLSLLPAPTFVVFSPVSHFPSFPLLFPASRCLSPSLRRFTELLSDIIISRLAAFSSLDMFDHKCSVAFSSSQLSSSFYHLALSKFLWIFLRPPSPSLFASPDYYRSTLRLSPLLWLLLNIDEKIKPFHISSCVSVPSSFDAKTEDWRKITLFLPERPLKRLADGDWISCSRFNSSVVSFAALGFVLHT